MIPKPLAVEIWEKMVASVVACCPHTCLSCKHFSEPDCKKYGMAVPTEFAIKENGCEKWATPSLTIYEQDMENIPF